MSRRRTAAVLLAAAVTSLGWSRDAAAQDIAAGRRKAVGCQTGHGMDGIAKLPDAPNRAGQPEPYLVRSVRAYRSGERRNEVMTIAAKPLTDEEIQSLASYVQGLHSRADEAVVAE